MNEYYFYLIIAAVICYFVYSIFKFVKRKIRWIVASLPIFATMGGINLPPGKWQHLVALLT